MLVYLASVQLQEVSSVAHTDELELVLVDVYQVTLLAQAIQQLVDGLGQIDSIVVHTLVEGGVTLSRVVEQYYAFID